MPNKTARSIIQSKIRKLEALAKLLDDPDIFALLPELREAKPLGSSKQMKLPVMTAKQRPGRRPGPLADKAWNAVRNSMREVTAKDVVKMLEGDGFKFGVKDKAVTVSKILRQLAKEGKLSSRPSGPGKKAAILYQSNAMAQSFPVQEITQ
jgi:hypothetical protein